MPKPNKPGGYRIIRPGIFYSLYVLGTIRGKLLQALQYMCGFEQNIFCPIQFELSAAVLGEQNLIAYI
jgi:hypothetical protein